MNEQELEISHFFGKMGGKDALGYQTFPVGRITYLKAWRQASHSLALFTNSLAHFIMFSAV